jgi:glycosyltransferase involved in cell wall biosynthesis
MGTPALSVIVIAQQGEASTRAAILSLHAQADEDVELVVVAHRVDPRVVEVERPPTVVFRPTRARLLPGAARNLGLQHSNGRFVAFLAADCLAADGWISRRIALHERGYEAVASAMTNAGPYTLAGWAHCYSLFPWRLDGRPAGPVPSDDPAAHGLSYSRKLLNELGAFREDLRIGEDSDMARRVAAAGRIIWFDPLIRTGHRSANSVRHLLGDSYARGQRAARVRGLPAARPGAGEWSRASCRRSRSILRAAWRNDARQRTRIAACAPFVVMAAAAYEAGATREMRRRFDGDPERV